MEIEQQHQAIQYAVDNCFAPEVALAINSFLMEYSKNVAYAQQFQIITGIPVKPARSVLDLRGAATNLLNNLIIIFNNVNRT